MNGIIRVKTAVVNQQLDKVITCNLEPFPLISKALSKQKSPKGPSELNDDR